MNKYLLFLLFLILLFPKIIALCEEGQIDINTASAEELDKITQIGPSRAQQIISLRPFNSVDDLARVSGIGNGTRLNQIKAQGLACVEKEEQSNEKFTSENETINSAENEEEPEIIETPSEESSLTNPQKNITAQIIKVSADTADTKNIKSDNSKELSKSKLAAYCLITFCVLLVALFMLKKYRYKKNEFK